MMVMSDRSKNCPAEAHNDGYVLGGSLFDPNCLLGWLLVCSGTSQTRT